MENFWEKLKSAQELKKSALVVGLDPDLFRMPDGIEKSSRGVINFLRKIIDATADFACAFKPNIAFYLALGDDGISILRKIISFIPKSIPVILDGKFGDVGHTAQNYARFAAEIGVNAVTLNPYIGRDAINPFIDIGLGVFLLCATSNPSFYDIQDIKVNRQSLFVKIAGISQKWSQEFAAKIGLVVGATHPDTFEKIRYAAPDAPFLVPGIGAQGGELEKATKFGKTRDGIFPLIVAARAIMYASSGEDFAHAAAENAKRIRDEINNVGGFYE